MFFELTVNYERTRKNFFFFGKNQFFKFYGHEYSDTGKLIAHV
jgi:hypothetical protein